MNQTGGSGKSKDWIACSSYYMDPGIIGLAKLSSPWHVQIKDIIRDLSCISFVSSIKLALCSSENFKLPFGIVENQNACMNPWTPYYELI